MDRANINIHVDSALKKEAEALFDDLGLKDEYEEMKKNPGNYKRYSSFDEVLDEVFADA